MKKQALMFVVLAFIIETTVAQSFTYTLSQTFAMTKKEYDSNQISNVCQDEFGRNARMADWIDIQVYYNFSGSLSEFFKNLDLPHSQSKGWNEVGAFVKANNSEFASGKRHFFISRHDGNRPSHYLSHSHINNHELDLGSWYTKGRVLCIKK